MIKFNDNINSIKGIGEKKRDRLNHMGIFSVENLLEHYPYRYLDKRNVLISNRVSEDHNSLVQGVLKKVQLRKLSNKRSVVECKFNDDGGVFIASFFNMPYLFKTLKQGDMYSIYGVMRNRNGLRTWTNPEIALKDSDKDKRGIIPVYRCTAGITNNDFYKWMKIALGEANLSNDWIGTKLIENNKLCSKEFALKNIHFPIDEKHYKAAKYRIVYDQLLLYQIAVKLNRNHILEIQEDSSIEDVSIQEFLDSIGFSLTNGQLSTIREIESDLISSRAMNRLIQGDVGCGKTVVAEAAIFKTVKAGYQAVLMAPTELLARQHYNTIKNDLDKFGYNSKLLISGIKSSERKDILQDLVDGKIDILIGTHAILQDDVIFNNLGLAITDEQHRFGVMQRKSLFNKGRSVNICVMSATPIPRTLAATVFGDMDFSIIKDKPSNRLPIITRMVNNESRERAYIALKKELDLGHQAYVVAPSINSEDDDISSVEELYTELLEKFNGYNVSLIHGKLDKEEKDLIMQEYLDGNIDILVSTTVIEVGIDVPNASIIILENSERFGLAQMHQLRGRVGRSNVQSYCYLVNYSRSESSLARNNAMVNISDGFEISEEDYNLRGPGDIMGTMQSGNYHSNILSLCRYTDILDLAINDAEFLIDNPNNCDMEYVHNYINSFSVLDNSNVI